MQYAPVTRQEMNINECDIESKNKPLGLHLR